MEARYRVPRTARITPAGGITPNFLLVEVYHTKFYHHNLLLRINQTQMHSIFTFSHFHIFELPHFQIATFQIPKPQNQISIGKLAHCFIGTFHFQIATFSNFQIEQSSIIPAYHTRIFYFLFNKVFFNYFIGKC